MEEEWAIKEMGLGTRRGTLLALPTTHKLRLDLLKEGTVTTGTCSLPVAKRPSRGNP